MWTVRGWVAAGLIAVAGLTLGNCTKTSEKADDTAESTTATSDGSETDTLMAGPMGRQGDTTNSSAMDAPQQAPPDSISNRQGATVPAEIKVRAKQ